MQQRKEEREEREGKHTRVLSLKKGRGRDGRSMAINMSGCAAVTWRRHDVPQDVARRGRRQGGGGGATQSCQADLSN